MILESPFRSYEQFLRRLANEALKYQVGAEQRDEFYYQVKIFVNAIHMEWMFLVFSSQGCATNNLHLMNF